MGTVLAIYHTPAEGLGTIRHALEAAGLVICELRPYTGEPVPPSLDGVDGLVLMGGPMGVHDTAQHQFLTDELKLIANAVSAGTPVLGVCLGSQLMAHALGARVYRAKRREIGWHDIELTENGESDPLLEHSPKRCQAFHWHGDAFDLPAGATLLASSQLTTHQAFRFGANAYGFLCHFEVDAAAVASMVEAFPEELADAGVTAEEVVAKTPSGLEAISQVATGVFAAWARLVRG